MQRLGLDCSLVPRLCLLLLLLLLLLLSLYLGSPEDVLYIKKSVTEEVTSTNDT